jgi:nucleotide-binding universal stress UspA family protein
MVLMENKILVTVDGSACSQIAIDYALWLGKALDATIFAQHVIDPRLMDLFIAPEFAECLGFATSVDSAQQVEAALRKIGSVILELFSKQADGQKVTFETFLDVGWIVDQILERAQYHDLTIVGHSGGKTGALPVSRMLGSVAERIAVLSKKPVLVATQPLGQVNRILVAFDGSEPARGALLLGKALSDKIGKPLKAATVTHGQESLSEAGLTVEQGLRLLESPDRQDIFSILEGPTTSSLLKHAEVENALLIVGAYGFRSPEDNVLGSTTTGIIRSAKCSVLIFR